MALRGRVRLTPLHVTTSSRSMGKRTYNIDGVLYVRADLVRVDEVSMHAVAARVVKAVADVHGYDPAAVTSIGRKEPLPKLRAAAIGLMIERGMGWSMIGRELRRNHSTVIACFRKHGDNEWVRRVMDAARESMEADND